MKKIIRTIITVSLLVVCLTVFANTTFAQGLTNLGKSDVARIKKDGRRIFKQYQVLSRKFDPAVFDLYADMALITIKSVAAEGQIKETKYLGESFKTMGPQIMAHAKEKNDYDLFSNVQYKIGGHSLIITAKRYSRLKKYRVPYTMEIEYYDGVPQIAKEVTEVR